MPGSTGAVVIFGGLVETCSGGPFFGVKDYFTIDGRINRQSSITRLDLARLQHSASLFLVLILTLVAVL